MGGGVGESSEGGDSVSSMSATKTAVNKEVDVSLFNPVSVIYFIWCAVALFLFCITLDAYRKIRKLKKSSPDVTEHEALEMLFRLKDKLKVRRAVALKASSEVYTPVSLGIFSPTIILPADVVDSGSSKSPFEKGGFRGIDELEMILTHELAHIKRCDYLINFLQNMLRAIFFFHPLFHFVSRNLTSEREHICDDWVVDMTRQRGRYAECIIGLLEKALYQPVNVPVAIAMAERKRDIPRRIDMIMDKKRKITAKLSRKALIAMLLIGFLALPIIGGIELVRFSGAGPASNEGRIVFARNGGIWVMDADAKDQQQIATGDNSCPAWSPNGRQIAFARWTDDGNWDNIYVMNADGSDIKQLTSDPESDGNPTWSPDGKQIAFDRSIYEKKDGQWQKKRLAIYVMDADGSNVRPLLEDKMEPCYPTWSPDSSKIAYNCDHVDSWSVLVMDADGDGENREIIHGGHAPDWSPDGDKIVFVRFRNGMDIYVINSDGANLKRLTQPGPQRYWCPKWSPDGTKIVFADKDKWDIYVMDADGSNVQALTNSEKWDQFPDWTAYSYGIEPTGKLRTTWGKIKCALGSKAND